MLTNFLLTARIGMLMKDAFAHDDDRLLVCCAFPQESLHNVPNKTLISVIAVAELSQ